MLKWIVRSALVVSASCLTPGAHASGASGAPEPTPLVISRRRAVPAMPAAGQASAPAPTRMSATAITGLFYMQKYWIATRHLEKALWYFAPDGRLYVNPERGFSAADLAYPKPQASTYRVANGTMTVEWNDGKNRPSAAPIELVPGGFNWDTGMYLPIKPLVDARRLVGRYDGGISMTLSGTSTIVAKTLVLREGGPWTLSGYSLSVTTEGGQVLTGIAVPFDDEKTAIYPDRLYFAGIMFKKTE